jgi:hypothetical protein
MRLAPIAFLALAVLLTCGACASSPAVTAQDLRGRRIVDVDRPVMATEYSGGRRVLRVDRDMVENGAAGFSLAIEIEDLPSPAPKTRDVEYVLPNDAVRAFFVVSGDAGRPFWSRVPSGDVRIRDFGDHALLSVNLDFLGPRVDKELKLPLYTWQSQQNRVGITGTFEAR